MHVVTLLNGLLEPLGGLQCAELGHLGDHLRVVHGLGGILILKLRHEQLQEVLFAELLRLVGRCRGGRSTRRGGRRGARPGHLNLVQERG